MILDVWGRLSRTARIALVLAIILALIWAGVFLRSLSIADAEVEADLAVKQSDAAIRSGQDATRTVDDQAGSENRRNREVENLERELEDADNASDAHAAGTGWLCDHFGLCEQD